jgi:hypothetical protein
MSEVYHPLLQIPGPELIALVPAALAHRTKVLPVGLEGDRIVLATADPDLCEMEHLDRLRFVLNREVILVAAPRSRVAFALWRCYGPPPPPDPWDDLADSPP